MTDEWLKWCSLQITKEDELTLNRGVDSSPDKHKAAGLMMIASEYVTKQFLNVVS